MIYIKIDFLKKVQKNTRCLSTLLSFEKFWLFGRLGQRVLRYIKNNWYINLGDGNHIRIIWSCSNALKTHNILYIPLKISNWFSNWQNFNRIYNNNSEENDGEEKESIDIEFTELNQILIKMKMLSTQDGRVYKKTRKIFLCLTSFRACKSKLIRKIFKKSNWMIVVSNQMKKKIKKIFLEVIINIKIFI